MTVILRGGHSVGAVAQRHAADAASDGVETVWRVHDELTHQRALSRVEPGREDSASASGPSGVAHIDPVGVRNVLKADDDREPDQRLDELRVREDGGVHALDAPGVAKHTSSGQHDRQTASARVQRSWNVESVVAGGMWLHAFALHLACVNVNPVP
jgi:hypothetical protein